MTKQAKEFEPATSSNRILKIYIHLFGGVTTFNVQQNFQGKNL